MIDYEKLNYGFSEVSSCNNADSCCNKECEHEKDPYSPPIFNNYDGYTVTDIRWKCKKCGEFYK
jgi:hypothetical protein